MNNKPWTELVGKKCWHVSAGPPTAPSFLVALGEKIPRRLALKNQAQPDAYARFRGSVELLVFCSWRLQTADEVLATSDQEELGLEPLRRLVGAEVVAVSCAGPAWDLQVDFADGRTLLVFCDRLAPGSSPETNWEIFLPDTVASAGPGSKLIMEVPSGVL